MSETPKPDTYISDSRLAEEMAYVENPYRELESHARELELGSVALDLSAQATEASNNLNLGQRQEASELTIRLGSFESARQNQRGFSDSFIDDVLQKDFSEIKNVLDGAELSQNDVEVINDPNRVAGLYTSTANMIARNLHVSVYPEITSVRPNDVKQASQDKLKQFEKYRVNVPKQLKKLHEAARDPNAPLSEKFMDDDTIAGLKFTSFDFEQPGVRANIKFQRQELGTFIMAYSEKRVKEKLAETSTTFSNRIYLNPDIEATPEIFEKLLQAANESGLSIQLKMYERSNEALNTYIKKSKGEEAQLRGDGIVIYTSSDSAEEMLSIALDVAKEKPEVFRGRKVSGVPQLVAEGIAVGDEPLSEGYSLTMHRARIIEVAVDIVKQSGKKGQEARDLFRQAVEKTAEINKVDPKNIAFNITD